MNLPILICISTCCLASFATATFIPDQKQQINLSEETIADTHARSKRTLFLKKKLIGAGLLGFGLGIAKGLKFGYLGIPHVHHAYSSPPVRYVEYVEKPVYVHKVIEKPVFHHPHVDYDSWSPHDVSYGSW